MIVRIDGRTHRGTAIGLHGVDSGAVRRAVARDGAAGDPDGPAVAVRAPTPGPVLGRLGVLSPGTTVDLRPALAAVARKRGHEPPQARELSAVRSELRDLDPPEVDRRGAREELAAAGEVEAELHERVAELRGRVDTLEERGEGAAEARRRLRAAAAELTEARTERIAAEQRLARLERDLREARDCRERRLRLEDRRDNLRREAREHLTRTVWGPFRSALESVPGEGSAGEEPGTYDGDDLTAALAVVRIAPLEAPVVLACGRFPGAAAARECLAAPVIRVGGADR